MTRAYRFSGIGRYEEMLQLLELHHAKVLIIPRVALSQSVRVANNDCYADVTDSRPFGKQKKKQSFSELLYGSPNWESEVKTTKCCFCRSDVSCCEQFKLSLLNEEVRHKSRRAHSGTSDIMHTTAGGIERREEMMRAISTASVILENITPSSSFTVCSRSEQ